MDYENEEREEEVLSYGEFVRRETLMAWIERKRAYELGTSPALTSQGRSHRQRIAPSRAGARVA